MKTRKGKITREELILLVGVGATRHSSGWKNGEPYTIFEARDLDYVRERSVRISRKANGDVEVRLSRYGGRATT
jgi:hypothetical protein